MSMVTGSEVWLPARRCRRKSQFSSQESASTTMSPGLTSQHSLSEQESGNKECSIRLQKKFLDLVKFSWMLACKLVHVLIVAKGMMKYVICRGGHSAI